MIVTEEVADRVRAAFERNFQRGAEVGASVAIWQGQEEMLCLSQGWRDAQRSIPWDNETLVLIWSATKGLASASVLHALDSSGLNLDMRVAGFWPEFAQNGKETLTIGEVLSHRAGLGALDDQNLSILDHESVIQAIEKQKPQWQKEHGYGPRTYGFIADEIVRRITGHTLGDYWQITFAEPLGLKLWIGLPESEHEYVAQMLAARAGCGDVEDEFHQALADPNSLTRRAFASPGGLSGISSMNSPVARSASIPSLGGIGSANSLAKFYAMLANGGEWDGIRYFSEKAMGWMTHRLAQGPDKIVRIDTAFSAGFMLDPLDASGKKERQTFGPTIAAFGHPGAGGSLGFADPENKIGFAYVMNQMESGVMPKSRALSLVQALYDQ